jgi:DNA polymerase III subunit gamma/tau
MINSEVKYAPQSLNDVVFNNEHYKDKINLIFKGFKCRHLMLSGTNGNGKTTIANLIASELTKHCDMLLVNDSIETVMSQSDIKQFFLRVKTFATVSGAQASDRVVIVFHELDNYKGSLDKLWTAMDELKEDLLVIITTNHPMSFASAVRSRCEKFDFTRIKHEEFLERAQFILKSESVHVSDSDLLDYLKRNTPKTSDVRDYLSALDTLIFKQQNNLPLPFNQAPKTCARSATVLRIVK